MTMKKVLLLLLPDRADVTSPLSIAVARAICSHLTMMTIIIIDIIIFIVFQIF